MKFWFDTEFIEDGRTIDLISIGVERDEHNALADAIWCAEAWKLLEALQRKWTCKVCGAKCYEVTA